MKQKLMWRYYCDFCKKGGCGKGAMAKHEKRCCRNPQRECGMCKAAGDVSQQDMPTLLAALASGGLEELTRVAEHCPACILATLIQDRIANPIVNVGTMWEYKPSREYIEFDYKAACVAWWAEHDAHAREREENQCAY